ncbi:MAG TPA: FkbM family methyltransferase [Candidatus Nanoarchaeia archaeon]|nr:FkbM family methyltransferase [Candidatus Nanoarchaeia archaeon]
MVNNIFDIHSEKCGLQIGIKTKTGMRDAYEHVVKPIINGLSAGKQELVQIKIPKLRYRVNMRSNTTDVLNFEEIFVNGDYDHHIDFTPRFIIDGGANVGYASVFYANLYPTARIIAIEPEKHNYSLLRKNVKPYPRIKTICAGIWPRSAKLHITNKGGPENKWGFMVEETKKISEKSTKAVTLDEIFSMSEQQIIDILKLDIEGSEKEVFSENYSGWLRRVKLLIIELHEKMRAGATESVLSAIAKFNFKKICLSKKYAKNMIILENNDI